MKKGEKAISCAANIAAGCATLADKALTGGALSMFAQAVELRSLFNNEETQAEIAADISAIKKNVYDDLIRSAQERGAAQATVDAAYLQLDILVPLCLPGDDELVSANIAPSEIGKLMIDALGRRDSRFINDPVWEETARRVVEGAFERTFEKEAVFRAYAPKIAQRILTDLSCLRGGQDAHRRENRESFEEVIDKLDALGAHIADPKPVEDQIRTLYQANDTEAQDALARGVPGDGLTDLAALNQRRVRHIRDMESQMAIERLQAARSCRAEGAAFLFLGQTGKALASYEAADEMEPGDFWTLILLQRLYVQSGRLEKAFALAQDTAQAALTEREQSVALNDLGDIHIIRGDLDGALGAYEQGLVIRQRLAEDETNAGAQRDLSVSLERIGDVKSARGDLGSALGAYEQGLVIRQRLADDETNAEAQRDLSVSLTKIGDVKRARGDLDGALGAYEQGLVIRQRLAEDETNAGAQRDLSVSLTKIGDVKRARGDLGSALGAYEQGLVIRQRLADDETNAEAQRDLSVSLTKIGDVKRARGDLDGALGAYEQGLVIRQRLAEDETNAGAQRDLSVSLERIGDVKSARGDLDGALGAYEKGLVIRQRLAEDETNAEAQRDLFVSLTKIGDVKRARGDLDGALGAYEQGLVIRQRLAEDETNAEAQRDLSVSLNRIGDVKRARGDLDGALGAYEKGLVILQRLAEDETNAEAQRDLSVSLERIGDIHEANDDLDAAIGLYEQSLPIAERLAALDPTNAQWRRDLDITRRRLEALRAKKRGG